MSISQVRALPVGNALQVFLQPPDGALTWRVLRKSTNDFTGEDDAAAVLVYEGGDDTAPLDDNAVVNGATLYYQAYYWLGSDWSADSDAVSGVAAATYEDISVDALTIVRDRLEKFLAIEVERGTIKASLGGIQVLTAPPVFEDTRWPVVTVHLQNDDSNTRSLGETSSGDLYNSIVNTFAEGEGWLSHVTLQVIGWSLNHDERSNLRQALRRAIVANLPVFSAHGLQTPNFSQQDTEDFKSFNAPVYQTIGTFSCLNPVFVTDSADPVTDVEVLFDDEDD